MMLMVTVVKIKTDKIKIKKNYLINNNKNKNALILFQKILDIIHQIQNPHLQIVRNHKMILQCITNIV